MKNLLIVLALVFSANLYASKENTGGYSICASIYSVGDGGGDKSVGDGGGDKSVGDGGGDKSAGDGGGYNAFAYMACIANLQK
ncbi:MAG: hypothetical protein L3J52_05515 [Proteobacteria bacterium]|nr:hypothetical protein [Pseudomonadota bacterium]